MRFSPENSPFPGQIEGILTCDAWYTWDDVVGTTYNQGRSRTGKGLPDIDVVDAEPAAVVLGGVAVAEEAELGAYPFARAGSETVRLVR